MDLELSIFFVQCTLLSSNLHQSFLQYLYTVIIRQTIFSDCFLEVMALGKFQHFKLVSKIYLTKYLSYDSNLFQLIEDDK